MNKSQYRQQIERIAANKDIGAGSIKDQMDDEFKALKKMVEFPKSGSLFRYRKINLYTLFEIIENYIFMSSPRDFNDPFDCQCIIKSGVLADLLGLECFRKYREEPDNAMNAIIKDYNQTLNETLKVACFTQKKDNANMWYHYAEQYKGICIEYDITCLHYSEDGFLIYTDDNGREYQLNESLLPVLYEDRFNKMIPGKGYNEEVACQVISLLKHKDWKNEEEWRLISYNSDYTEFRYLRIKAIYFGKDADDAMIKKISTLLKEMNIDIKLYKMNIEIDGFCFNPIDR